MKTLPMVYSNKHGEVYYDDKRSTVWCYYGPGTKGCVSLELIADVNAVNDYLESSGLEIKFMVEAGASEEVYCTGGDLELFVEAISTNNRELLRDYAYKCIELQHKRHSNEMLSSRPVTISFVRGMALGGGFESALGNPFIIAENNAKFAFPEAAFNLFPGMGGFPYLHSKTGDAKFVEKALISGSVLDNEELLARGVIDKLVPNGEGVNAINGFIDNMTPRFITVQATLWNKQLMMGIPYEVMKAIADRWVEDAFKLSANNLAYMTRLVSRQQKRFSAVKV